MQKKFVARWKTFKEKKDFSTLATYFYVTPFILKKSTSIDMKIQFVNEKKRDDILDNKTWSPLN